MLSAVLEHVDDERRARVVVGVEAAEDEQVRGQGEHADGEGGQRAAGDVGLARLEEAVLQHDADGGAGQGDEPGRRRHGHERQ